MRFKITDAKGVAHVVDDGRPLDYLFNADCLGNMKIFPDKYFDLAIVDP